MANGMYNGRMFVRLACVFEFDPVNDNHGHRIAVDPAYINSFAELARQAQIVDMTYLREV